MPVRRERLPACWLALLLLASCSLWGGPRVEPEPVSDDEVLAFAERIGAFYQSISSRSLNTLMTFEDAELRGYFLSPAEFADYYASLTSQVIGSNFRHARAREVHVREFRFEGPDRASVDVTLVGKHQRGLRFWDIEIDRTDAWKRESGVWLVDPARL